MKIVTLQDFFKLPAGTIYSEYQPAICTDLFRKGETCTGLFRKGDTCALENGEPFDFFYASVCAECYGENDLAPTVDDIETRWGLYDGDAQFAVYEPADLEVMRKLLFGT